MKRYKRIALLMTGLLLWLSHPLVAEDPPAKTAPVQSQAVGDQADTAELRDPAALAELKRATDFLTALPRFHIKTSVVYDVIQEDGRAVQYEKTGDIFIQRPDRFFVEAQFDDGRFRQYWYDGKTLSLAERSKQVYTQIKTPPTIDKTLDMMEGLFKEPQPLSDLFYSDLSPLDELALEADVVGDSIVNGRPCTHLSFRGKTVDWQIWVEKGATPFIRKLVISYRQDPGTPQSVALLDVWETPKRFQDSLFRFTPPKNYQWVDVLVPGPRVIEKGGRP